MCNYCLGHVLNYSNYHGTYVDFTRDRKIKTAVLINAMCEFAADNLGHAMISLKYYTAIGSNIEVFYFKLFIKVFHKNSFLNYWH